MSLKLTVLGSGTSVPHPRRSAPANWVEADGCTLLLDIGGTAPARMAAEGCDWANLDAVWVSHFHLDHAGGLAPFLFGMKYAPQTRERRKPLVVYGPRGTRRLLEKFDAANAYGLFEQPFPLEVREVSPRTRFEVCGSLRAETFSTPHTRESLALRLTAPDGASLVYTSDTGPNEALAAFARATDLLLMECSFFRTKPVGTHLDLKDAMTIARLASARQVVLTHLYPEWDGVNLTMEARRFWDGEVFEASDGMRIEVRANER